MANITWTPTKDPGRSVKGVAASGTAAFDAGSGDGASLDGVAGYTVIAEADSGQTLSGAGSLLAYALNTSSGVWARWKAGDLSVDVTGTPRAQAFAVTSPPAGASRVAYAPSSVTLSAGGLTIYILCQGRAGERV